MHVKFITLADCTIMYIKFLTKNIFEVVCLGLSRINLININGMSSDNNPYNMLHTGVPNKILTSLRFCLLCFTFDTFVKSKQRCNDDVQAKTWNIKIIYILKITENFKI